MINRGDLENPCIKKKLVAFCITVFDKIIALSFNFFTVYIHC